MVNLHLTKSPSSGISAVIICKNAESDITNAILSLRGCDEILIADTGSTDQTIQIAEAHDNVTVVSIPFEGFGPTKQKAVTLAKNDWILSLDSDEAASQNLISECKNLIAWAKCNIVGVVHRKNYLMGHLVRYSGWGNDNLVRFFNKRHTNFDNKTVHEAVEILSTTQKVKISGHIHHYTIKQKSDFKTKNRLYSSLRVAKETRFRNNIGFAIAAAALRFVKTYFAQLGFLDGKNGLTIAYYNARGVFRKYNNPNNAHPSEIPESKGSRSR